MLNTIISFWILLFLAAAPQSNEINTVLSLEGGNPPVFVMTGNGILTSIRVRGHNVQREGGGEQALYYWVIRAKKGGAQIVDTLGSVTYGKTPEGYLQKYPESGEAPPLNEGEHYYIDIITTNANGVDGYFMIHNGKALFAKYRSQLPKEINLSK